MKPGEHEPGLQVLLRPATATTVGDSGEEAGQVGAEAGRRLVGQLHTLLQEDHGKGVVRLGRQPKAEVGVRRRCVGQQLLGVGRIFISFLIIFVFS